MNWTRNFAAIITILAIAAGTRLHAGDRKSADATAELAGQWVAYHWDGEGAPVRLELEIRVSNAEGSFAGVLRESGVAPRTFQGSIVQAGVANAASGFRMELLGRGESRVEMARGSSYTAVAFWKEQTGR